VCDSLDHPESKPYASSNHSILDHIASPKSEIIERELLEDSHQNIDFIKVEYL
jgi:hypothetical protein